MKNALLTVAFVFTATSSLAGGYGDPIVEAPVVVADTVANAGSDAWVLALMTFVTIGLAIAK